MRKFVFSYGCCLFCCCCKDQLPPKAKRLKSAIESIEAYRGQQLGKLQDNYAQQVNSHYYRDRSHHKLHLQDLTLTNLQGGVNMVVPGMIL